MPTPTRASPTTTTETMGRTSATRPWRANRAAVAPPRPPPARGRRSSGARRRSNGPRSGRTACGGGSDAPARHAARRRARARPPLRRGARQPTTRRSAPSRRTLGEPVRGASRPTARTRAPGSPASRVASSAYDSTSGPTTPRSARRAATSSASPPARPETGLARRARDRPGPVELESGAPGPPAPAAGPPAVGAGWWSTCARSRRGPPSQSSSPSPHRARVSDPLHPRLAEAGAAQQTEHLLPVREAVGVGPPGKLGRRATPTSASASATIPSHRFRTGGSHRESASAPPCARTRASSATAASGAGRWLRTKPPTHASKLPAANGSATTSAWTNVSSGSRRRASASIPGATSTPVGLAPRSAARPQTTPRSAAGVEHPQAGADGRGVQERRGQCERDPGRQAVVGGRPLAPAGGLQCGEAALLVRQRHGGTRI